MEEETPKKQIELPEVSVQFDSVQKSELPLYPSQQEHEPEEFLEARQLQKQSSELPKQKPIEWTFVDNRGNPLSLKEGKKNECRRCKSTHDYLFLGDKGSFFICERCAYLLLAKADETVELPLCRSALKRCLGSSSRMCHSPFIKILKEGNSKWFECSYNSLSTTDRMAARPGFLSEEDNFFLCEQCLLKWKTYPFAQGETYFNRRTDQLLQTMLEQPQQKVDASEYTSNVINIDALSRERIFFEMGMEHFKECLLPSAFQASMLLGSPSDEDYTKAIEVSVPQSGGSARYAKFLDVEAALKNDQILTHDFYMVSYGSGCRAFAYRVVRTLAEGGEEAIVRSLHFLDLSQTKEVRSLILETQPCGSSQSEGSPFSFLQIDEAIFFYEREDEDYLQMRKMHLETLEDNLVKDFDIKNSEATSILFLKPVNDLYIVYWKKQSEAEEEHDEDEDKDEEEEEVVVTFDSQAFSSEETAMKTANDLNFNESISAVVIFNEDQIMWASGKVEEVRSIVKEAMNDGLVIDKESLKTALDVEPRYEEPEYGSGVSARELCFLKQTEVLVQSGHELQVFYLDDMSEPYLTKKMKSQEALTHAFSIIHLTRRNIRSAFMAKKSSSASPVKVEAPLRKVVCGSIFQKTYVMINGYQEISAIEPDDEEEDEPKVFKGIFDRKSKEKMCSSLQSFELKREDSDPIEVKYLFKKNPSKRIKVVWPLYEGEDRDHVEKEVGDALFSEANPALVVNANSGKIVVTSRDTLKRIANFDRGLAFFGEVNGGWVLANELQLGSKLLQVQAMLFRTSQDDLVELQKGLPIGDISKAPRRAEEAVEMFKLSEKPCLFSEQEIQALEGIDGGFEGLSPERSSIKKNNETFLHIGDQSVSLIALSFIEAQQNYQRKVSLCMFQRFQNACWLHFKIGPASVFLLVADVNKLEGPVLDEDTEVFYLEKEDFKIKVKRSLVHQILENAKSLARCHPQKVANTSKRSPYYPVIFAEKKGAQLAIIEFGLSKQPTVVDQIALDAQDDDSLKKIVFGAHIHERQYAIALKKGKDIQVNMYRLDDEQKLKKVASKHIIPEHDQVKSCSVLPMFTSQEKEEANSYLIVLEQGRKQFVVCDDPLRAEPKYASKWTHLGYQRLRSDALGEVTILSVELMALYHEKFDSFESHQIISAAMTSLASMRPFEVQQLFQTDRKSLLDTYHPFQPLEILHGMSIAHLFSKQDEVLCRLFEKTAQDRDRWDQCLGSVEDSTNCLVSDFTLTNLLDRCLNLSAGPSVELVLQNISEQSKIDYSPEIMRALPHLLLRQGYASVFPFFEQGLSSSLEKHLVDENLPLFKKESISVFAVKECSDNHNPLQELLHQMTSKQATGEHLATHQKQDEPSKRRCPQWACCKRASTRLKGLQGESLNFKFDASLSYKELIEANLDLSIKTKGLERKDVVAVSHSYVDFREMAFGEKLMHTFGTELPVFTNYSLSQLISQCKNPAFFNQELTRKIINAQFAHARGYAKAAFWFYLLAFVFPFMLSLYWEDSNKALANICLMIGLVPQLFFFLVEISQIKKHKLKYFKKMWNVFDILQFALYVMLMLLEFATSESHSEPSKLHEFTEITIQAFLIIVAFVKIQYFIRIFEQFGFLVQMILMTVLEVIPFTVYLIVWIVFFALSYTVLKAQIEANPEEMDELEYPEVNNFIKQIIWSYRNSVGDIAVPNYETWIPEVDDSPGLVRGKYFMMTLVWSIWLFNQFINLIILLNFLIAVISQTYEKVISMQETHTYIHRAQINEEVFLVHNLLKQCDPIKILGLSIDKGQGRKEDDEWQGMISSLKKHITGSSNHILAQINKRLEKIEEQLERRKE